MAKVKVFASDTQTHRQTQSLIIHVKLEKFKKGRSPSLHLAKEGEFARNHSTTLSLSIYFQIPAEILTVMRYSLLIMT